MARRRSVSIAGALSAWAIALVGCQGEIDPSAVSARVVAFGEFEIERGLPKWVREATTIPCEPGRIFGVDYRLEVSGGQWGEIPVEFRWTHPEFAIPSLRQWGTESAAGQARPALARGESGLDGRALWTLEHPDELISGRYEFRVRLIPDGTTLLSRSFQVEGC